MKPVFRSGVNFQFLNLQSYPKFHILELILLQFFDCLLEFHCFFAETFWAGQSGIIGPKICLSTMSNSSAKLEAIQQSLTILIA